MKHIMALIALAMATMMLPVAASAAGDPVVDVAPEARTDIGRALDTFLSDEGDALILLPNRLDKSKLDFTLESLEEVDQWLEGIHTINALQAGEGVPGETFLLDGRGDNSVTFAGLYLGEVVRQNSEQAWMWQRFDIFTANNPAQAAYFGDEPGVDAYVLVSEQGVATPINQALKRVLNGQIDSVHYIGQFLSTPVDLEMAMGARDMSVLPEMTGPDSATDVN